MGGINPTWSDTGFCGRTTEKSSRSSSREVRRRVLFFSVVYFRRGTLSQKRNGKSGGARQLKRQAVGSHLLNSSNPSHGAQQRGVEAFGQAEAQDPHTAAELQDLSALQLRTGAIRTPKGKHHRFRGLQIT